MFKRPRLRPVRPLVNVSLAACAIFISACGSEQKPAEDETEVVAPTNPVVRPETEVKLQAVWSTRSLSGSVVDIGISGGPNPMIAAALDEGNMQLFDLEGEQLSDPSAVGVEAIADGQAVTLNDTRLTLFPGIGGDAELNIYVFSSELGRPVAIELIADADAAGLCAGPTETDGTLQTIAYWSKADPQTLIVGNLFEAGEVFGWDVIETRQQDQDIGACLIVPGREPLIENASVSSDLTFLRHADVEKSLRLNEAGELEDVANKTSDRTLSIRDGISVRVPEPIIAMAALWDVQSGGYPNGVIVIGGQADGASKLVFIEPIGLFEDAAE